MRATPPNPPFLPSPVRAGGSHADVPARLEGDPSAGVGGDLLALLNGRRVAPCYWDGLPAFVKRKVARRRLEAALLAGVAPLLRRWLCPCEAFVPVPCPEPKAFEVSRLLALGAAGAQVPRVFAVSDGAFVMESLGRTLEQELRDWPEQATALLMKAADGLMRFHGAGQWHGCAQIRNMVLRDDQVARFDFDRAFDLYFPLPVLQALDIWLFLGSAAGKVEPACVQALAARCHDGSSAATRAVVDRVLPVAKRLLRSPWFCRLAGKEARRLQSTVEALACKRVAGPD